MKLVRIKRKHPRKKDVQETQHQNIKFYDNFKISLYFVTMVRHYANKWLLINDVCAIFIILVSLHMV